MSGHRVDVIELLPATFRTAEAIVDNPGIWILHCHVVDHQIAGMGVFYRITNPNDPPSLNLAGFQTSKIDMSAPPALRPGRAEAATAAAVNKSSSVSLALLLLIVLSAFIL